MRPPLIGMRKEGREGVGVGVKALAHVWQAELGAGDKLRLFGFEGTFIASCVRGCSTHGANIAAAPFTAPGRKRNGISNSNSR